MNYLSSSPDTATSESCNSSASSSVNNANNYQTINNNNNNNDDNEILNSLNNIDIDDFEDEFTPIDNSNSTKLAPIDLNLLNDDRVLQNLLTLEDSYTIQSNYFSYVQQEIKPWMRNVLSNWMLEVCDNQNVNEEVFVLAMSILDRFLSVQAISKRHLQLLGTVCMFIASKLRCSVSLNAETLVIYTDRSINLEELLNWEQFVLQKLHWDVCSITPNDYIPHLLARLSFLDNYTLKLVREYLTEVISLCSTGKYFFYFFC
jgi:hypothetical protein